MVITRGDGLRNAAVDVYMRGAMGWGQAEFAPGGGYQYAAGAAGPPRLRSNTLGQTCWTDARIELYFPVNVFIKFSLMNKSKSQRSKNAVTTEECLMMVV